MLSVEFVLTMSKDDTFCSSADAFKGLLKVDSKIKIKGNEIVYNDKSFKYHISVNDITDKKERFFDLKFSCDDDSNINEFNKLIRDIRIVCSRTKGALNVLWDDTSFFYAKVAYQLVYKSENLLRKLITKFMLTTVGSDWTDKLIPDDVRVASDKQAKKRAENNPLFEVDFIKLSDFLFKPYSTNTTDNLLTEIHKSSKIEEFSIEKLKAYLPKSNWERFFSKLVSCEGDYLRKKWARLYELRCQVAHNAPVNHSEFSEIEQISGELEGFFLQAIESIDNLNVSSQEKVEIAEALANDSDERKEVFNHNWKEILTAVRELYKRNFPNFSFRIGSNILVRRLQEQGVVSEELAREYTSIQSKRMFLYSEKSSMSVTQMEELNSAIFKFGMKYIFMEEPFWGLNILVDLKE
jgi:hypothetical protein